MPPFRRLSGDDLMQTAVALLSVGLLKYDRDPSAVARLLEGMGLGWISQDSISCALSTLTSQFGEDRLLLPTLLQAARGGGDGPRAGTFVELGALDGTTWSNTLVLERCFGWRGLLIEANPMNFYKLNQSTRTSHKVHSAVCTCAEAQTEAHQGCTTVVSARSGPFSGNPNSSTVQKYWSHAMRRGTTVSVPCKPLQALLRDANLVPPITFLSLDVEGAEDTVLQTVDPAMFRVVLVELDGNDPNKDAKVTERLLAGGLVNRTAYFLNVVFLGLHETLMPPLPLNGTRHACMQKSACPFGQTDYTRRCCWEA